jgi:preprotein translocase subunit SecY
MNAVVIKKVEAQVSSVPTGVARPAATIARHLNYQERTVRQALSHIPYVSLQVMFGQLYVAYNRKAAKQAARQTK